MVNKIDSGIISNIIIISNEIYFHTLMDKGKVESGDFDNLINTLLQYASLKDINNVELCSELENQDALFKNDNVKSWFINKIKGEK